MRNDLDSTITTQATQEKLIEEHKVWIGDLQEQFGHVFGETPDPQKIEQHASLDMFVKILLKQLYISMAKTAIL